MSLFLYYSFHSTWNQLRRVFKTWIFLVALAAVFGGGLIGLSLARSGAALPATSQDIATATSGLSGYFQLATISKADLFEFAFTLILFSQLTIQILASEISASRLFLPADINFLFTSDRKPQEILSFRIMSTVGTMFVATIYILFQARTLIERFEITYFTGEMLLLAWIMTIMFGVLFKILLYELTCKRQIIRSYLRYVLFAVFGIIAAAFYIFYVSKSDYDQVLAMTLIEFFNKPWTHLIPIYGWIKGFVSSAVNGDTFIAILYAVLNILTLIGMRIAIRMIPADFYEEATIRSEELALYYESANQSDSGLLVLKPSSRKKGLQREGFHFGNGASVYFFKPLYNRFRFSMLHVISKSTITYFIFAILVGLFSRKFMETPGAMGSAVLISGLVLFHSILDPVGEDVRKVSFIMNPENTWTKLFYSLCGGTVNCLLDIVVPLIAGSVAATGSFTAGFKFIPFILSVDFFASAANTFLYLAIPTSFDKTFKQVLQILIMYFAFIPDALFIISGIVRGQSFRGFIYGTLVNLFIGLVLFGLTGVLLDPTPGALPKKFLTNEEKKSARTATSVIGLALCMMYCLVVLAQLTLPPIVKEHFPDSSLLYTISYFVPTYCVAFPLTIWTIRRSLASIHSSDSNKKRTISFTKWLSFVPVCFFLMYSGSFIGLILTNLFAPLIHVPATSTVDPELIDLRVQAVFAVLCAPVFEELLFRKVIINKTEQFGTKFAVVFSAVLFGLFHGNIQQACYATLLGLVFGTIYIKTKNLKYTISLHMMINFIGSAVSLITARIVENPDLASMNVADLNLSAVLSSPLVATIVTYIVVLIALSILGFVLFAYYLKKIRLQSSGVDMTPVVFGNAGMPTFATFMVAAFIRNFGG